jgi:hypothetical protein
MENITPLIPHLEIITKRKKLINVTTEDTVLKALNCLILLSPRITEIDNFVKSIKGMDKIEISMRVASMFLRKEALKNPFAKKSRNSITTPVSKVYEIMFAYTFFKFSFLLKL